MNDQFFADGIGGIAVVGTTVRMDFVALSPSERGADGKPKTVLQSRVVMSVEGFLHAAGKVQEVADAIAKIGAKKLSEGQDRALTRAVARKDGAAKGGEGAPQKGSAKPPFP